MFVDIVKYTKDITKPRLMIFFALKKQRISHEENVISEEMINSLFTIGSIDDDIVYIMKHELITRNS